MLHPTAKYQEFQPSPDLAPYVKCYALLEYDLPADKILTDHFLPFGRPYLNIAFRGEFWIDRPLFKRDGFSSHHIAGQILQPFYHYHSGDSGMIGIFFHPSGFHQLFGLPMSELTQNSIDLEDFLGSEGRILIDQITNSVSSWQKVNLCEQLLRKLFNNNWSTIDDADRAIQLIRQDPTLPIDEVCKYFNISSRHLRRRFKEKVGIGPKYYLRICRFHRALQLSHQYEQVNLQDLSYTCGYYDQSHFSSDFQQFTGKTPFEYLKKNQRHLEVGGILQ
ncbi:AraC family transcriptional regulator [Catalinimonas sp. 4WD22]|uniref:AraC family transcriptional regulator n=1 Tax=Catalinimonas locisalis TaxID=3133978 RepID=UPI003101A51E